MLERIADKWTLLVLDALEDEEELRFSRLREKISGVSQKMLTKTLRHLERDGLVTRRVHAEVPPRVDYRLTELGLSLSQSLCGVWVWAGAHLDDVEGARQTYDARNAA
jgi:DNA-binding HxlR family transcriptional regulator